MKQKNTDIVGNIVVDKNIHDFYMVYHNDNELYILMVDIEREIPTTIAELPEKFNSLSEQEAQKHIELIFNAFYHGADNISVHFVPLKYLFNNQQVTDIMLYGIHDGGYKIVLAKRKYPPMGLALFGGMVEKNETATSNTKKEIEEEANVNMDKHWSHHVGTYELEEVRGTLTTNFTIIDITDTIDTLKAGDDVTELHVFSFGEIEQLLKTNQVVPHHKFLIQTGIDFINTLRDIK